MIDLERIVPLHPEGTATPLFCVHASSGSAYSYFQLAQLLGADRPVYGIEAPGFDGDREPVGSLPALSAEYAATLQEFQPDADFLLLGWSFGGIIALDMARRLTAAGARVPQLIMIDASVPWVAPVPPEKEIVRRFLREMVATVGASPAELEQILAGLPDDSTSDAIFATVQQAGALPDELDEELLDAGYPVFRAHLEAMFGFEVTEPYHGPVVHLMASESPPENMRWHKVITNLTEHTVAGSHHSIWTGDSLLRLAELTRAALANAG